MKSTLLALSTICGIAAFSGAGICQTYTFKLQNFAGAQTFPNAISNRNIVVGLYTYIPGYLVNSYVGKGSHLFAFNYPDATMTICNGVNKSGTIAGEYLASGSQYGMGYTYVGGVFTSVLPPGAKSASVTSISDNGKLGGEYSDASGIYHAFIKTKSGYQEFDIPGTANPKIVGINNAGQYVVQSLDVNHVQHSYLSFAPYFIELDYPGSAKTDGYQINNKGQVALDWQDDSGVHGGVYDLYAQKYYKVDYPGASSTVTTGINDDDTLVGTYVGPDYPYFGAFIARGRLQ
jgi:hypothetical protein